jgi:hypothetical protein
VGRAGGGRAAGGDRRHANHASPSLRHDENATGSRSAGSARPSCSPPASARPRSPAGRLPPGRQRLVCPLADSRHRRAAQPRTDRAQAEAVRPAAGPRGAGAPGGHRRQRVVGELWTLDRVALVIERRTGVRHHPAWVWALLRYWLGWTVQRPKASRCRARPRRHRPLGRRALAADQANAQRRRACLVLLDESALSLTPPIQCRHDGVAATVVRAVAADTAPP